MLFRVVSDTHFEQRLTYAVTTAVELVLPWGTEGPSSTLILAGDISSLPAQRRNLLREISKRAQSVIYVPGNHEHYGGRLSLWNGEAQRLEAEFPNVHIGRTGEAQSFQTGEFQTIYATMWAPYGVHDPLREMRLNGTSDCWWTQADDTGRRCVAKDFQALYTAELAGIKRLLTSAQTAGEKTVVVTHHVPSLKMRHPDYPEDVADDMFMAPEAESFMYEDWAPKFWFFGHTHKAWDIQIGNTRCISNPYGYPNEKYQGWVSAKVV